MEEEPTTTTTTAPETTYTTTVSETINSSATRPFANVFDDEAESDGTQHEELTKMGKLKKLGKFVLAKLGDESDFVAPKSPKAKPYNTLVSPETWAPEVAAEEDERFVDLSKVGIPSYEQGLSDDEVLAGFLERSFVKVAPSLDTVASDTTRTNTIKRIATTSATGGNDPMANQEVITETEQEAASGFKKYLEGFIRLAKRSGQYEDDVARAEDILKNLTFIGEKERQEATKGISTYWKHYLKADPGNQLCVVAGMRRGGQVKSGEYLLDSILGEFTEAELEEFKDRLVTNLEDITSEPEQTKIILLDDWVISGSQMGHTISSIQQSTAFSRYRPSIEINLVTCPPHRIEDGFYDPYNKNIPIKSYFLSHTAEKTTGYATHNSYETGAHSSVDFDFESSYITSFSYGIRAMQEDGVKGSQRLSGNMPGLTTIVRPYRQNPLVNIKRLEKRVETTRNSRELQGVV